MSTVSTIITGKKGRNHKPENDYNINLEPVIINGKRKLTRYNKKVEYAIYKLTEPITNRVYIGATSIEPSERWQGGAGYKNNEEFYYFIKLAGWENIKKEVIAYATDVRDAQIIEAYFIKKYYSNRNSFGYNLTEGGDMLKKFTEKSKEKMSNSHKGLKESIDTKKKKSNKVIAIKDNELYICDSGKLLGDLVGSTKDYVKNCLRRPCKLQDFQVFYFSKEKRDEVIEKKLQNPYSKGLQYLEICKYLDMNLDEENAILLESKYDVRYLVYSDNEKGYEIK